MLSSDASGFARLLHFFHGMICIATKARIRPALEHTNAQDLHWDQVFATLCSGRWLLVIVKV